MFWTTPSVRAGLVFLGRYALHLDPFLLGVVRVLAIEAGIQSPVVDQRSPVVIYIRLDGGVLEDVELVPGIRVDSGFFGIGCGHVGS